MKTAMPPFVFTTPKGDEMVVLPKADYDALLAAAHVIAEANEDAADVAAYDAAMAYLAAGGR